MKRFILFLLLILSTTAHAGGLDFSEFSLDWSGGNNSRLAFSSPLTSTSSILTPPRAYPGTAATFTRASASYLTDYEGVTRKIESGSVGVEGSRVVTNLLTYSEDLSNAAWGASGGASKTDATTITFGTGSDENVRQTATITGGAYNNTVIFTATVSGTPGAVVYLRIMDNGGSYAMTTRAITLTATPTRYTVSRTCTQTVTSVYFGFRSTNTTAKTLIATKMQAEVITAQTNTNPGEYVKTTTAAATKCFPTTNGNSTDVNGVVTEAVGTPLPQSYPNWTANKQYTINDRIQANGWWYYATNVSGASGSTAPTWLTGSVRGTAIIITDGSMVWTLGGRLLLGYVSEPASTNKTTAYGIIPADTLVEVVSVADNRTFASDTGWWTKGSGWAIGSGTANATTTSASLVKSGVVSPGKWYTYSYDVTARSAGSVTLFLGSVSTGAKIATGTFTGTIQVTSGTTIDFAGAGFTGSIDNVSVQEVAWKVDTKSWYVSSAFIQNIPGLTLAGDVASVLSIVTDQTEIEKAGLSGINPTWKVYKLDNSLGSAAGIVTFTGTVGNTNKHTASIISRYVTNVGMIRIGASFDAGIGGLSYQRDFIADKTPADAGAQMNIYAGAGRTIYFLLPQLEESSFSTSIMPTAGATATRAATSLSYPATGNLRGNDVTVGVDWFATGISSGDVQFSSGIDASNWYGLFSTATTMGLRKLIAASETTASATISPAVNSNHKIAGVLSSTTGIRIFVNGAAPTTNSNKNSAPIGTTFTVGCRGISGLTAAVAAGYFRNLRIYWKPLSDDRCKALTQ